MARMIRPLANLYEQLRRLPGVGSKTAMRLAYHIIDMPEGEVQQLAEALSSAKKSIHYCSQCYNLTDGEKCAICSDPSRDSFTICVVEQPQDIAAMERSHGYNGLYHVLHGVLSPLDGVGPDKLKIRELFQRLQRESISEIIIATNSDVEGEATATYLAQLLKPIGITVSRIAHGLPMGGDLEYADEVTLSKALENRRAM
ncbi:recombination mediator RecR [Phascolarctobacterium sp.]|uniref:recombination mediator RecR n=1 Tax=Phascolarctobacterium sp. TaxID=2049039 RepID=UPI002A8188CE|nr:recombination mediator RecR [Phascolarctobacterium sp.]MDY5045838.1 recombination mediator RecR [Phascolarctobacterium sp.]